MAGPSGTRKLSSRVGATRVYRLDMSYGLNSLKGGYMGDYIGDYYRGY